MTLRVHTYSNKGGRDKNEDCIHAECMDARGIFVLADGLGGHKRGEVASQTAVEALTLALKNCEKPNPAGLREAFLAANQAVLDGQKASDCKSMKTTAVVLQIAGDKAIWGHVGDSRLYHFANGEIASVTKDQSVTYKKYLGGEISYQDIRNDEDRSSLLSVLGNEGKCSPETPETLQTIASGDAFLLCSDGFWEYVFDEEMLIDLLKSETTREWIDYMLLRHIKRTRPSYDNYSLIAVLVQ